MMQLCYQSAVEDVYQILSPPQALMVCPVM